MKPIPANFSLSISRRAPRVVALAGLLILAVSAAHLSAAKPAAAAATGPRAFATPNAAANALINAAGKFDVPTLEAILGPQGHDLILTGEKARDRQRAADFVALAREKKSVVVDPQRRSRAILSVGKGDWPYPVPIVRRRGKWYFDARAGRQEIFFRRIGENELDAIRLCRGYVEAQYDYAYMSREGFGVHQYAQRVIASPGKRDGLAWQNPDGTWGGPVGEPIARAIQRGASLKTEPYHGYFFKVLKGQGPAAPMGKMNYVVKNVMIGGFALAAAPAQYRETGVMTFIVSQDGTVYQKNLGPNTLQRFRQMQRYNPDRTWRPVREGQKRTVAARAPRTETPTAGRTVKATPAARRSAA
jgi:hypothetical protein